MELAEQVANEQDPVKFGELVSELNRLLSEKDSRLHASAARSSTIPETAGESKTPKAHPQKPRSS